MSDFIPDYRAKRLTGEWVEGFIFKSSDDSWHIIVSHKKEKTNMFDSKPFYRVVSEEYRIDPATLCRNTTATMPDGSIVWSEDLLLDELGQVFVIQWDKNRLCWIGGNQKYMISVDLYELLAFDNIKRIGNLIDNPELMREKK